MGARAPSGTTISGSFAQGATITVGSQLFYIVYTTHTVYLTVNPPPALTPANGVASQLARVRQAGTGPFSLHGSAAGVVVLDRNRGWWGSPLGLGPELDQIAFRTVPDPAGRAQLLRQDAVRVAADLPQPAALRLSRDPLITAIGPASGHALAFERSVRGIDTWRPQSLSPVWLALVGPGGG